MKSLVRSFGASKPGTTGRGGGKRCLLHPYMRKEWCLPVWRMAILICVGVWWLLTLRMAKKYGTFFRFQDLVSQAVKLGRGTTIRGNSGAVESGKRVRWILSWEWSTSLQETLFPKRGVKCERATICSPARW